MPKRAASRWVSTGRPSGGAAIQPKAGTSRTGPRSQPAPLSSPRAKEDASGSAGDRRPRQATPHGKAIRQGVRKAPQPQGRMMKEGGGLRVRPPDITTTLTLTSRNKDSGTGSALKRHAEIRGFCETRDPRAEWGLGALPRRAPPLAASGGGAETSRARTHPPARVHAPCQAPALPDPAAGLPAELRGRRLSPRVAAPSQNQWGRKAQPSR